MSEDRRMSDNPLSLTVENMIETRRGGHHHIARTIRVTLRGEGALK